MNPIRWRNSFSYLEVQRLLFLLQAIYRNKNASDRTVHSEKRVRLCMLTRHRLMYGDRLSAVSEEHCVFVSSADGRLTANKIFKSRHRDRESDVMSRKCSRVVLWHRGGACWVSLWCHISRRKVLLCNGMGMTLE